MADIEYKQLPEKTNMITQQNERFLNRGARRSRAAGGRTVVIFPGDDIQKAIDALEKEGGGRIYLRTGTHKPHSSLTIPPATPIQIEGENTTSTIIDFNSTSSRIIVAGTGIYTTGTVSITSGVTVTGSSTSWLSSGLVAGNQIFLDSRWYKIAAVTGDTTIILSEGYSGTALSGATYRAGSVAKDCEIKELTIQGCTSASGALDGDDVRNLLIEDVQFISNNKAIVITNFSEWTSDATLVVTSTGDGVTFNTGTFCNNRQLSSAANGGHGVVLTSMKTTTIEFSSSNSNTSDGYNITSCTDLFMSVQASGNGGRGIEAVSGNDNILIGDCLVSGNTSDGIKFTATTDNCRISTGKITGNGGYGINIAASTCDNNIIVTSIFAGNSTAAANDSGTGTVVRGNVGLSDNSVSSVSLFGFLASDTLQVSADVEHSTALVYPNTTPKEILVRMSGTIRVKFDLKGDGTNPSTGRIYVNGSIVGTQRSTTSATYVTYSEDITVVERDLVQLRHGGDGIHTAYTKNFRLYWTDIALAEYVVNAD